MSDTGKQRSQWFYRVLTVVGGVFFVSCILLFAMRGFVLKDYPRGVAEALRQRSSQLQVSTVILDRYGEELGVFSGETRYVLPISSVPKHVVRAFLAAEDGDFYQHFGVSVKGMLRAVLANLRKDRYAQGGSTITQQMVRQLLLDRGKTLQRKFVEVILAVEAERSLSKSEILELWLNSVYFGNRAWGIEAAARHYFKKNASGLNVAEAAMLAGILQAPSRLAPHAQKKPALDRQRYVLSQMYQRKWITDAEYQRSKNFALQLHSHRSQEGNESPWATEPVRLELWKKLELRNLPESGLVVKTTFDKKWQRSLEQLVQEQLSSLRSSGLEAAIAIIDGQTGEVRTLIGGTRFQQSQFHRATALFRPVGAVVFPLIFAWAAEQGVMGLNGYTSLAEAAVSSHFAEAELLAPQMGYGFVKDKFLSLGFVVKDSLDIDNLHTNPVDLARALTQLTRRRRDLRHSIITGVFTKDGGSVYKKLETAEDSIKPLAPSVGWAVRQWMGLGARLEQHALASQPVLKAVKGWNSWSAVAREDVIITAWVGADRSEPRNPRSLKEADRLMDQVLSQWITKNLSPLKSNGIPSGISFQMSELGRPKRLVRLPIVVSPEGVF